MTQTRLLRERYEPLEELGSGGQGRVVRARDHQLGRDVALKIRCLTEDRAALLSEARALVTLLPHPGLPLVRDDFFLNDSYVLVMDWIDGAALAGLLAERGRPGLAVPSVLGWLAQAGEALAHLHGADPPVVHGDVSPANLVLARSGRVVLVDLGLATIPSAHHAVDPRARGGTDGFLAPEVAAGSRPTPASDIYGLAATACSLLTGSPPSLAPPLFPSTLTTAEAKRLEFGLRRGLATDPMRRPTTAGELVELLRAGWDAEAPSGVLTMLAAATPIPDAMWADEPHRAVAAELDFDEGLTSAAWAHRGRVVDVGLAAFHRPADAVAAVTALGAELVITAGIDTGQAQQLAGRFVGPPVARARRIRDLARRGEVLVSDTTAALVMPPAQLVDLGPYEALGAARVYALDAPGLAVTPDQACPWPGLPAYGVDRAEMFVGREEAAADVRARLASSGFVAVVGASGVGKSSLLRAGVAAHVTGAVVVTPASVDTDSLAELGEAPLVVVDQLEEAFTLLEGEQQSRLLDTIIGLPGPVAVGIRADQYARCAEHPGLATVVSNNHILLGPLGPDEIRRVVSEPAARAGLEVEQGLADLVVADLAGAAGQLPLLSHALRATWERRDGRTLTVAGYQAAGGALGALARTAEALYGQFDDNGRACAKRIALRLVQPAEVGPDSRRRARLAELQADPAGRQVADGVIAMLVDARLVTIDGDSAEVAHEALLRDWPRLREWIDEDRAGLLAQRALVAAAANWAEGGHSDDDLYRGGRLAAALELATRRDDIVSDERAFLDASQAQADRALTDERRTSARLRRMLGAAAVALLAAVVAGWLALVQAGRASDEATAADAARLSAESRALLETRHDVALLLAVAARRTEDNAQTQSALLRAVQSRPLLTAYLHEPDAGIESAAYSEDGQLLVTVAFDGVRVWDAMGGRSDGILPGDEGVSWFSVAVAGQRVYAAGSLPDGVGGVLAAWNLATREQVARVATDDATMLTEVMAAGDSLVTAGFSATPGEGPDVAPGGVRLRAWNPDSLAPLGPSVRVGEVNPDEYPSAAMRPDGRVVAVNSVDGTISLFDSQTLSPQSASWPATRPGMTGVLAFSPDGSTLAVAWADAVAQSGVVDFHDPATGEPLRPRITLGAEVPQALAYHRDGQALAVGGSAGSVSVLSDDPALWIPRFTGHTGRVNTLAWRPDGSALVSGSYDRTAAMWDVSGRQAVGGAVSGHRGAVSAIAAAGDAIVTARSDGALTFRDSQSLAVTTERTPPEPVWALAAEPSGSLVAAGGDRAVTVWDANSARQVTKWTAPGLVGALAWSTAGDRIAGIVKAEDRATLLVWDPSGRVVGGPWVVGEEAAGVAWHPDLRRVAVVGGTAQLWDTQTGEPAGPLLDRTDADLLAAVFTADGSLLTGAYSGAVDRWDVDTAQRLEVAGMGSNPVVGLAVSADGTRAAAVTLLGDTQLIDLNALRVVGDTFIGGYAQPAAFEGLPNGGELPFNAQFLDDGRVATAGVDMGAGSAKVWNLDPNAWEQAACSLAGRDLTSAERAQYQVPTSACPVRPTLGVGE